MGSEQILQWKEGSRLLEKFSINLIPERNSNLNEMLSDIPKTSLDLISKMLHLNPSERISLKDVLKHPFFTGKSRFKPNAIINSFKNI